MTSTNRCKTVVVAGFLGAILFSLGACTPIATQVPMTTVSTDWIGKWGGKWTSNGRRRTSHPMEIEIFAVDGDRVTGQARFDTYATPPCSFAWAKFVGTKSDEKVFAQVDIQGRCDKVGMIFWMDSAEKNVMTGTYNSPEFPDNGNIRLTRQ